MEIDVDNIDVDTDCMEGLGKGGKEVEGNGVQAFEN